MHKQKTQHKMIYNEHELMGAKGTKWRESEIAVIIYELHSLDRIVAQCSPFPRVIVLTSFMH